MPHSTGSPQIASIKWQCIHLMSEHIMDLFPQVDLGNTFGAFFIAVTLAAILFGLTNVQAFIYFQTHTGTGIISYKLIVIWLWILDALHLSLIVHCVYHYLVINYANFSALTEIVWSFKLQVIVDVLIVPTIHLSYLHRIWIFSKGRTRVLPAIAFGIIVVLCSGVAIPVVWGIYKCHTFGDLIGIEWWTYAAVGSSTLADIVIASSLCYLLVTSHTGFSSTDSLLTKLVGYTISTGSLTSVCSIAVVITCATLPKTFIFLAVDFLVAKLYVNSFIVLLNARYYMQASVDIANPSEFHMRRGVCRSELPINRSQDTELQASRKDYDDEVLHITHPIQDFAPPTALTLETKSFSLA
ncbi:hypothetical protein DEU56DRAFT_532272 [Suillus clintonianus]|uniref:uncharacterized protein n=1 Tax=Suillus clintonianus TaxID=1904413 RepID=UPI001B8783FF|nr:uncharacterized protein DEU56DRAFT_532272 [Suillus clintonianus]KAG2127105.1 hypothetical protein DEU56DRAFT_532272 [Suillus clintonianus]